MIHIPEDMITRIMQEVVDKFLIPRFYELNMNATGEWINSLQVEAEPMRGIIKGRPYTEQLVNGRMPGQRPPIAPLERWAQAKLGLQGAQARSAAFAIANKIAAEGTTWYQKGGSSLLDVLSEPETVAFVNNKIGEIMSFEVATEIRRKMKEVWQ